MALDWLEQLRAQLPNLRSEEAPRPYWSQKQGKPSAAPATDLPTTVTRCRSVIADLKRQHWFARTIGYDCVDAYGDEDASIVEILEHRIGKPHLEEFPAEQWTEDDLCDYVEVLHDIAARPTRGSFHSYSGCGWHPTEYDRASGQALYRWRINQVLDTSTLGLRLAEEGNDLGRIVRQLPNGLDELAADLADVTATDDPSVPHAISLFRRHGATREERRSAVLELAAVLEAHRPLLKDELTTKDASDLFQIANNFGIRHRRADQQTDYPDEYLDWLFHWYLATVDLIRRIVQR